MKEPKQLVIQINQEEKELNEKLTHLENFMMCEDFIKISAEQKRLLEQQHKAMTEYKLILIKRAHRINWEAGRDKTILDICNRKEKEDEKPTTTNPEILGCEDCKHALYKPEDKGKPSCGNPDADGKTCWESTGPQIREYR